MAKRHRKRAISERVMDIQETANILGITKNKCYELARNGTLPGAFKLDKRVLVSRVVFDRFLNDPQADLGNHVDNHA